MKLMNFAASAAVIAGVMLSAMGSAIAATPLVSSQWLSAELDNPDVVVIDLRNKIDEGSYELYLEGHIPGALHSDYLKDGWRVGKDDVVGLLPSEAQFEALARRLGISADSHVVLVPAGVSSTDFGTAARAYWTFKVFSHDEVSILDGGYAGWKSEFPSQIETGAPVAPETGDFDAVFSRDYYTDVDTISAGLDSEGAPVLLDARTEGQFYGTDKHPKSATHGRIPGAVLLSQAQAYDDASNRLKTKEQLAEIYGDVNSGPVVSYCNTGHWAATNWFVLAEVLGNKDVKLYDGSMVEWTSQQALPLETGRSNLDKIKGFFQKITG